MKIGKDDWFLLLAQGAVLILATLGSGGTYLLVRDLVPQGGKSTGTVGIWQGKREEGGWWTPEVTWYSRKMDLGTNDLGQVNIPLQTCFVF